MIKIAKYKKTKAEIATEEWLKKHSFIPRIHDDDRRRSINDVFGTKGFDINISYIYPGRIVAWHRHLKQPDYWFLIKGSLKVGLYDEDKGVLMWVYMHEWERKTLYIPPKIWHGWRNINDGESILCYYITPKYNEENPDEERAPIGAFGENWDVKVK